MASLRIAAIDPGKRNFAFAVLCFELEGCDIRLPKKKDRYLSSGEPSPAFLEALGRVWRLPYAVEALENVELQSGDKGTHVGNETLRCLTKVLDTHSALFDKCDLILIEKQMGFGKAHNTLGLRIAQHCLSYFLIRYDSFKEIQEYPAYHKTQILGAPKGLSKPQRKKWSVEKAKEVLSLGPASAVLDKWRSFKKRDDVSDCVCMCFAYLIGDVLS